MMHFDTYKVGIIADDLTSATDAAMAFLARGYRPLVLCDMDRNPTARIAAVDIDSRSDSATAAAERTKRAISALAHRPILLKTVDSTLRGHARTEISAAFSASGRKRLVIAPAFPAAGRITKGGVQYVNGLPVDQSAYAADPVHPVRTARIADLIDSSFGPPRILCGDGDDPGDAMVLILDAARQNDLDDQVRALGDPSEVLWVGSPGLAIALAALAPRIASPAGPFAPVHRLLIVAGSANPVTHSQCDRLAAAGIPVVADMTSDVLASALCLAAPRARQAKAPLSRLADQAASALFEGRFDGVIATGGETMTAILARLGLTHFHLTRELEPGFPVGQAMAQGHKLTLAMKAGGFGGPDTLLQATAALQAGKKSDHD